MAGKHAKFEEGWARNSEFFAAILASPCEV